jgi:hypothetical protein
MSKRFGGLYVKEIEISGADGMNNGYKLPIIKGSDGEGLVFDGGELVFGPVGGGVGGSTTTAVFSGSVTIADILTVNGAATDTSAISTSLTVDGTPGLNVASDTTVGGILTVGGAATDTSVISTSLTVNGTTGLNVASDATVGGALTVGGVLRRAIRTDATLTVTINNDYIINITSSGTVTATLPLISAQPGVTYIIVKAVSSAVINLECDGTDTFASTATTITINELIDNTHITVVNNGVVWMVV